MRTIYWLQNRTFLFVANTVCVDHLGLSKVGFTTLLKLVEKGTHVKATGFGRVDFKVESALKDLFSANPHALMFGTDLPSTRARRFYEDNDFLLIIETLGAESADKVFFTNAVNFYHPEKIISENSSKKAASPFV